MSDLAFGLMQDRPLLIASLLTHAARFSPNREIVSRSAAGARRYGYRDGDVRARKWAKGL